MVLKCGWMGGWWYLRNHQDKAHFVNKIHDCRFGFDGSLMAGDREVPVTAGLHHHGEEQERPGYTLEEMIILCRQVIISYCFIAQSIIVLR